jgi:hypothetical protein
MEETMTTADLAYAMGDYVEVLRFHVPSGKQTWRRGIVVHADPLVVMVRGECVQYDRVMAIDLVRRPPAITIKQMCEAIADSNMLFDRANGKHPTAREIFEGSPTGDQWHVAKYYDQLMLMRELEAEAALGEEKSTP